MATLVVRIPVATAAEQERLIAAFKLLRRGTNWPHVSQAEFLAAVQLAAGLAEYVEAGVVVERADEVTFWSD